MIDAHHHFWNYNAQDFDWINEEMSVIRRSFLPPDLSPILKANGITGSVLIQVNRDEKENEMFLQYAHQTDFVKGTVAWIDLKSEKLEENLEKYHEIKKLKGFREIVQGKSDVYFPDPSFRKGVELLGKKGYTYDILIYERDLKNTFEFVKALPNNKFVIDHIAKPDIKNGSIGRWSNYMKALAQFPNVSVKISGMTTEAYWDKWQKEDFYIYLDHLMGSFGIERLMYGSDWPVCLLASKYEEQLDILKSYTANLSSSEKSKIFNDNATDFYHL